MGRHELPRQRRNSPRTSRVALAALLAPAAAFFAVAADCHPTVASHEVESVAEAAPHFEVVTADPSGHTAGAGIARAQLVRASRLRVSSRFLAPGVAPEHGLQVKTILAARAISAAFPQIHQMGGVRPDPLPWHPRGLAVDVMIPNPTSAEGIALGDAIVAFVLQNADRFAMQDAIWRGVYYTPHGARPMGMGHYDHVHVTTFGGGYPTGDEIYLR